MSDHPPADPWARPAWTPGGGDAFVSFVVFDADADLLEISTEAHRVEEVPEGLDAHELGPDWVAATFAPPMGDLLRQRDPDTAARAEESEVAIVVTGTVADPPTLTYLRDAVGIATAALETGGVAVLDLPSLELFDPARWRDQVFDGAEALPRRLVSLLSSPEDDDPDGLRWVHTRGLRTFGRPDLSLRGVAPADLDRVVALVDALVVQQARGLVIADGSTMDVGEAGTLRFRRAGDLDDPEFNNVHLDVDWR